MTFLRVVVLLLVGAGIIGGLAAYQDRITERIEAERDAEFLACKLRECEARKLRPGVDLKCDEPGAAER